MDVKFGFETADCAVIRITPDDLREIASMMNEWPGGVSVYTERTDVNEPLALVFLTGE